MDDEAGPGRRKIDPTGSNPLTCRVLAHYNRRHADRTSDLDERMEALEVAHQWEEEAARQEQTCDKRESNDA